jgi:hypothetical protein
MLRNWLDLKTFSILPGRRGGVENGKERWGEMIVTYAIVSGLDGVFDVELSCCEGKQICGRFMLLE